MARRAQGTSAPAAGLFIVRAEHQGPTGLLITMTRTADVSIAPAQVTSLRTVEVEAAVDELRSFLNAFWRGR
jgi:hypothetical protein